MSVVGGVIKIVNGVMVVMRGEKVGNLYGLKGGIVARGAVSNMKKPSVKVEPGGSEPSEGPTLTERRTKHQSKGKKRKVTFVLPAENLM